MFIYNLCFGFSKLYTNIQHMSMLFTCMAGGERNACVCVGGGRGVEVLKCFVRGGQNFFYLIRVWGGSGSVPLLP